MDLIAKGMKTKDWFTFFAMNWIECTVLSRMCYIIYYVWMDINVYLCVCTQLEHYVRGLRRWQTYLASGNSLHYNFTIFSIYKNIYITLAGPFGVTFNVCIYYTFITIIVCACKFIWTLISKANILRLYIRVLECR